jgi:heme/copper-type cytochrome/quinol oxidase subunit 2
MAGRLPTTLKRFVPWLALAGVALLVAWAPLPALAPLAAHAAPPGEHTIRLEARSFEYTPPVIHVNQGDRVTLEVVSTDVVHGIYIDGYGLETSADPGQTARLTFVADQAGSFRFRCSVSCGALHPFMIGQLKVGPNTLLWRGIGLAVLAVLAGWLYYRQPLGAI